MIPASRGGKLKTLSQGIAVGMYILALTGWLATVFGRKRLLLVSVIGFTSSSVLCGAAPNLTIGQGFPQSLPVPTIKPSSFLTPPLQLNSNAPSLTTFDPNLKLPTTHEWSLSFQR